MTTEKRSKMNVEETDKKLESKKGEEEIPKKPESDGDNLDKEQTKPMAVQCQCQTDFNAAGVDIGCQTDFDAVGVDTAVVAAAKSGVKEDDTVVAAAESGAKEDDTVVAAAKSDVKEDDTVVTAAESGAKKAGKSATKPIPVYDDGLMVITAAMLKSNSGNDKKTIKFIRENEGATWGTYRAFRVKQREAERAKKT